MKSIFEYIDYRKFLKDFYTESKETKKYFSYRYFAQKAKINSPILLKMVIDGKRNLSRKSIEQFISGINLKEKEALYFRTLVLFNQAETAQEKQEHYRILRTLYKMVSQFLIEDGQFEYFEKWYYSVIREGICHFEFKDNWEYLASCVRPQISALEVKDAVKWLLEQKFLKKNKNGMYEQLQRAITTKSEVFSFVVRTFNRKMIQLAEQSLDSFSVKQRFATGMTIGLNLEAYDIIIAEIVAFRDHIVQLVNSLDQADRVYQLNVQLFPLMLSKDQENQK
jgi:uncharacterized protein (TIGR02147 family)